MKKSNPFLAAEAADRVALRKRLLSLIQQIGDKEIELSEAAEITNAAGKYWKGVQLEIMAQMVTQQGERIANTSPALTDGRRAAGVN